MGAPVPEMEATEDASAEALLSSLKTIAPAERRKHASVFNYWHSIRGKRQFPPIRDLDPLEISDAGPWSVLLEMIGGGEDAVVRHFGQSIRAGLEVEKIVDAPNPSLLSCIHNKLPIVAACRQAFAFEESFETETGATRCWVTLLPFSDTGTWIDYVYGYVSLSSPVDSVEEVVEPVIEEPQAVESELQALDETDAVEESFEPFKVPLRPLDEEPESVEAITAPVEITPEPVEEAIALEPELEPEPEIEPELVEQVLEPESETESESEPEPEPEPDEQAFEANSVDQPEPQPEPTPSSTARPSFSAKLLDGLASIGGFYGTVVQAEPSLPSEIVTEEPVSDEPITEEPMTQSPCDVEGTLQSKLTEVRAKAEEARMAQLRSEMALIEGLGAAYDFALDAEQEPEEYLRLVEAQGLKIQLRSPMKPVVKLAFDGTCDDDRIAQLEAVLAWAFKMDLPRGSLAERIAAEGGIGQILGR
jgi:hypothetical protein